MWYPLFYLMCMCPSVHLSVPRWFPDDNLRMDQRILFNLWTVVKYHKIQIKFEFHNWFKSYGRKDGKYAKTWQGIISCPIRCPIFFCTGANKSLRLSVSSTPCRRLGDALLYFGFYIMSVMVHGHLCFTMKITLVKWYYLMIFWVIKQKSRTSGGDRF